MDMFSKSNKPEPFKQDPISGNFDVSPSKPLVRGAHGRFVSKKELEKNHTSKKVEQKTVIKEEQAPSKSEVKKNGTEGPFEVMFYGKSIRKYNINGKWFYCLDDILALNINLTSSGKLIKKQDFDKTKKDNIKRVINIEVADKDGIVKIIRQVEGTFPGPLVRWLEETSQMLLD